MRKRVVGEGHLRVERRVEHPSGQVPHAAEGVDEPTVGHPHGHRVDREVAPGQIGLQVVAERHRRLAVLLGVDLFAEGRDLQARVVLRAPTVPNRTPTR